MGKDLIPADEYRRVEDVVDGELHGEITRAKIFRFQDEVGKLPQVELPLKHYFAPGAYGREIFIPKGCVCVGKIHKHAHLSIISKGDVTVVTEQEGRIRMKAPYTFVSQPGAKRVVFAHEDTIWTTFHVTNETDLEKIEDDVIARSYEEFDALAAAGPLLLEGGEP